MSYKKFLDAFMKKAPEKIKKGSSVGDFARAKLILIGAKDMLLEKGLVDQEFLNDYAPREINNGLYVRLDGVLKRIKQYQEEFTSFSLEKNIIFRPQR